MQLELKNEPYDVITLPELKSMKGGDSVVYFIGTSKEAHKWENLQQMRVVKEAIRQGIVLPTQKIIDTIVEKKDIGLDIQNIYAYTVTRTKHKRQGE
jgi:hypothetical protein